MNQQKSSVHYSARPRHGNSRRSARARPQISRSSNSFCRSKRAGGGVNRQRADSAESLQTWQETKPLLFTEARVIPAYKVTSRRVFISRHAAALRAPVSLRSGKIQLFPPFVTGRGTSDSFQHLYGLKQRRVSARERNKLASVV